MGRSVDQAPYAERILDAIVPDRESNHWANSQVPNTSLDAAPRQSSDLVTQDRWVQFHRTLRQREFADEAKKQTWLTK